jgi:hypothetical protein
MEIVLRIGQGLLRFVSLFMGLLGLFTFVGSLVLSELSDDRRKAVEAKLLTTSMFISLFVITFIW